MKSLKEEYFILEKEFLTYSDLKNINIEDNSGKFIVVPELNNFKKLNKFYAKDFKKELNTNKDKQNILAIINGQFFTDIFLK